jgi:DNA-binding GntR family transcriptional regulator
VRLRRGIAQDAALTDEHRREVEALLARLSDAAVALVSENWDAVERVAGALADGRMLSGAAVDALISEGKS